MLLAKISGGAVVTYPYTRAALSADYPRVSFPAQWDAATFAGFNVVRVVPTPQPEQPAGMTVEEAAPEYADGAWRQAWAVRAATPEELAARVPASVTMRQARLALLGAGMLAAVETAIDALDEPARSAARIEWDYSSRVERHNGFVEALAPALGLTAAQLDALFVTAATL